MPWGSKTARDMDTQEIEEEYLLCTWDHLFASILMSQRMAAEHLPPVCWPSVRKVEQISGSQNERPLCYVLAVQEAEGEPPTAEAVYK